MADLDIRVDFRPVTTKLKLALKDYSEEVQARATYNALNYVGAPLLTAVRRHVRDQSGAKYGRVAKVITAEKAHPNRLTYTIHAKDVAMPLIDFVRGAKAGKQNVTATPWNVSRKFPGTFIVPLGGKLQVVKRVAPHKRNRDGPLGVKVLWGPILPKEMLRPNKPSFQELERAVPQKLIPRLMHELEQAQIRAKARSGT